MAEPQSRTDRRPDRCRVRVALTNKIGLHARPAIQLTKLAKRFSSRVRIKTSADSPWIDAKSIVQVMAAKAPRGTVLEIEGTGDDAGKACRALAELIRGNFGEQLSATREMPATGHIASRGLAIGKVVFFHQRRFGKRSGGTAEQERRLFERSVEAAREVLAALRKNTAEDIAEVLEFQLSLVQDRTFINQTAAAIAAGIPADLAWTQTMDEQIRRYETSKDSYFRERSADLVDLKLQVLAHIHGKSKATPDLPPESVVIADDLSPSDFARIDLRNCTAIVLKRGSLNSHVALLARARRIPMLVGLPTVAAEPGTPVIVDALEGRLIQAPDADTLADYRRRMAQEEARAENERKYLPAVPRMPSGDRVSVGINVGTLEDLQLVSPDHCDGIGLVRTEFLFRGGKGLPDEDTQFRVYRQLVQWAGGKPVIIRTLDAGGDKPVTGLTAEDELNPFLGVRGIRLSLLNENVFRVQLRALLRASAFGNLKIMLPMVTVAKELNRARRLLQEELVRLRSDNPDLTAPPLGIMIEVPAAAMCIDDFSADFFSIGSNDLIQYVAACDRGERRLAHLYSGVDRAVFGLIQTTIDHGRRAQKPISLCGDMASQPEYIGALLEMGLRSLSVSPADLARVKARISAGK